MESNEPKILLFDLETFPNLGFSWGQYDQNIIKFKREWGILCWCAKWLDSKKVIKCKLPDYKLYKRDKFNDKEAVKKLWKLVNEADVLIAHNGINFDIRRMNARFIYHNLPPPSPYKVIDTKRVAKRYFHFNSNSLDNLGQHLKLGQKNKHSGFSLWEGCMNGNMKDWNVMIKYNVQDVILLEKIYKKLRPFIINHPNWGLYIKKEYVCPNCGSTGVQRRGYYYTKVAKYQRWQCQSCGAWSSNRFKEKYAGEPMLKN